VERTMLTVALMNSVVETHNKKPSVDGNHRGDDRPTTPGVKSASGSGSSGDAGVDASRGGGDGDAKAKGYSLRKRRRSAGEDLRRLEHFQASKDGGLARSAPRRRPQQHERLVATTPRTTNRTVKAAPSRSGPVPPPLSSSSLLLVPNPLAMPVSTSAPVPSTDVRPARPDQMSVDSKKKVTISHPGHPAVVSRARGFSIDLDNCEFFVGDGVYYGSSLRVVLTISLFCFSLSGCRVWRRYASYSCRRHFRGICRPRSCLFI
jgi:hypothetical protein